MENILIDFTQYLPVGINKQDVKNEILFNGRLETYHEPFYCHNTNYMDLIRKISLSMWGTLGQITELEAILAEYGDIITSYRL